jgi:hypothetical protein
MTPTNDIRPGGAVVFWTLSEFSDSERLADGLADAGFGDLAPEPRPLTACLKAALQQTLAGPTRIVRPLQGRDGFSLVEERRGRRENYYAQALAVTVEGEGPAAYLDFHPLDGRAEAVRSAFALHRGLLACHQVSDCLVRVVGRLGGTSLRPRGGMYWLADDRLPSWEQAARATEKAAYGRPHACYRMRVAMDADAVRAVRDAVCAEVLADATRIRDEVLAGGLGGRALETRRQQALELRDKVQLYEGLLDTGLARLREAVDAAEHAAGAAALLAAAPADGVPA